MKNENQEQFEKLSFIEDGWFNQHRKEGKKVTKIALHNAKMLIELLEEVSEQIYIYPTITGGVQLEVILKENNLNKELIVEIYPDGDFL
jgi:hypothetical protein